MGSDASGALALEGAVIRDFDRMYRENIVYVLQVLRRFGLSHQAAEDLAQDVFEAMFLKLLSLDAEERRSLPIARAYLFRIAWNLFSNHRRLWSVRRERPAAEPPEVLVDGDAHDYVLAREMVHFLDALTPHEVTIFVGFEVFGTTASELARDLRIDERDVWRTLHDVRARLRRASTPA
jgi:RNA polymerase sigma factor (sigma-70 family)